MTPTQMTTVRPSMPRDARPFAEGARVALDLAPSSGSDALPTDASSIADAALREQFARLVRQHSPSVVAVIRRRADRCVDPEDVAQEVFCKAWLVIRRGEKIDDFRAWVLTIAYRDAVSASRKAKVRRALLLDRRAMVADHDEPSADHGLWDLARRILAREQSTALWLTVCEGLTARQVGRVIQKDERAVRMLVSRARKRLAEEAGKGGER